LALGLGVVVMLTALVLSRSRLGILSCAAGLLLMPALWRLRSAAQAIVCAGAAAVALSAWIGLGPLLERISATAEDAAVEKGRFLAWESTLRMTMAHPLAGVGLGAFPAAFAPYHPEGLSARFRHPHNEILAVGAEMGLPVLIALLAWLIRCGRTAWKQAVSRRDPYAVALLSAISAIVFHSLGDFNLRIPANGLLFSMWVGMAIALLTAQPSPAPRRIAARCVSSALLIPATAWAVSLLVVGEAPANPAEALSDLRRAATLEPFSGALHWREGLALKALGRQEEADREMAFAARCDPTHPDLQFKIGTYFWSRYAVSSQPELRDHAIAAFRRGDVERALRYLAREGATPTDLEEVAPAGSPDLAELRIRSGAREEVIDAFVKTRPTDEAYDRLAKAALEIGWTAGAIRLLEERLRIRDEVDAWLLLSSCWAQIGEWENARRAADGARRTDPNRPEVHVAYARACLELGDPGAAVETLAEAVRLRPEVFEYRWDYARALLRVGRRTEAERVLRDLSRMTQTSREQVVALARLCLEAGFKETAREALERSLSRFPEDDEIRALLLEALDR
ncbi:MAG: O-antigen ligase family protein, partial [Planctomycetes bacterium]|nr:O-antigen ligase family protein [Planctomycetota bacterium]